MQDEEYYTIFTKVGQAKIANAIALGKPMQIKYMAIGDGGGEVYEPDVNQTELRHEVYRSQVSSVIVSDADINQIQLSMLVPADVGGFTIREVGHFDADGDLIAVTKPPADPKPALETGAAKDMQYNINIIVDNMAAIELKVDPTVIIATKTELRAAKAELQAYTDDAAKTAVQTAKDYTDQQIQTVSDDIQQLLSESVVHYKGFADIDAAYTSATPLVDVIKAMADNSILFAAVEVNDDYPAAGNLQIIRYADHRADCQLRSTNTDGKPELWLANFTPAEMEQIFGGGGALNKWSKVARGADLQIMDTLQGIVRYPCSDDILPGDPVGVSSENEVVKIDDYTMIDAPDRDATVASNMGLTIRAQATAKTKYIQLSDTVGVLAYLDQQSGGNGCTLHLCTIGLDEAGARIVETQELSYYSVSIYFCVGMVNMDGTHVAVFCDDNLIICTIEGTSIKATKSLGNPWTGNRSTEFCVEKINDTQILCCFTDYANSYKGTAVVLTLTNNFQGYSKGSTSYTLTDGNYNEGKLIRVDETHYHFSCNKDGIKMVYLTVSGNAATGISAGGGTSLIAAYKSIGNGRSVLLRKNGELSIAKLNDGIYQYTGSARVSEEIASIGTTEQAIYTGDNSNFICVFTATIGSERGLYGCAFHILDDRIVIDRTAIKISDFTGVNFIFNMGTYFILDKSGELHYMQFTGLPGILKCLGIVQKTDGGMASIATKGISIVNIKKETAYKVSGLGTYLNENIIEIENVNARWLKIT